MSGGPIYDIKQEKVVGIASNYNYTEGNIDRNLAIAIPVDTIVKLFPDLYEMNPGLILFNQFLMHIERSKDIKYENFEDVYVPPKEYPKIRKTLEDKRCVFITGTPEYGKTYTAVKLMWDKWRNSESRIECKYPRKEMMEEILRKMEDGSEEYSNSIIYIEDPTGHTEYIPNPVFRDSIVRVISHLSYTNSYLIVTMRDNIYQRTKIDMMDESEYLEKYVQRLEMGAPSYGIEERREMLLRWANKMKCSWLEDEEIRNFVLGKIKEKLPTPFNIYDFCVNTGEKELRPNMKDKKDFEELIQYFSQKTARIFATDLLDIMKNGEDTKILFICFPFISEEFVHLTYNVNLIN